MGAIRPFYSSILLHPYVSSEGGVGVVLTFNGEVADIRYIIDGKTENRVALSRLTTIAMPHRRATAQLRPRREISAPEEARVCDKATNNISNIEWLKKGLKTNAKEELTLRRTMLRSGWLNEMLVQANAIQRGEKACKERCFDDYKAQLLYIEGMKAVLGVNGN